MDVSLETSSPKGVAQTLKCLKTCRLFFSDDNRQNGIERVVGLLRRMISPLGIRLAVCAQEGSLDQLDLLLGDESSFTAFIDQGHA